jgi:hypothetical protein
MRHEEKFVMSHKPFAVVLASLHPWADDAGQAHGWWQVQAVWFRRRYGVTVACVGNLHTICDAPRDAREFLTGYTDGRYGGHCDGRWDGTGYWGAENPDTVASHLMLLRPMLENFPAVPAGFDGWWTFKP